LFIGLSEGLYRALDDEAHRDCRSFLCSLRTPTGLFGLVLFFPKQGYIVFNPTGQGATLGISRYLTSNIKYKHPWEFDRLSGCLSSYGVVDPQILFVPDDSWPKVLIRLYLSM
jgi:hypothetical protein